MKLYAIYCRSTSRSRWLLNSVQSTRKKAESLAKLFKQDAIDFGAKHYETTITEIDGAPNEAPQSISAKDMEKRKERERHEQAED